MNTAPNECMLSNLSELEDNFGELSKNVANLEKDIKKLVEVIKLSTYNAFTVDNQ